MSKIRVLSELVINRIAAGEVIESPASIIKELIDNAVDAGAQTIEIEIEKGGFGLISVSDDGSGMDRDDAIFCFERHATSKIKSSDDLFNLSTLGFRGEALSSIAAISHVNLSTKMRERDHGSLVKCHGGKIFTVEECAKNPGTMIRVTDLFYNVPVRKKFQKSLSATTSEAIAVVTKQMLSFPEIHFKLCIDGKELFHHALSKKGEFLSDLILQATRIFNPTLPDLLKPIDIREGSLCAQGFLGDPALCKSNRKGQYLFINRRAVQNFEISLAIQDGYGSRIPERKYPFFIMHLHMDPELVDANVHPQKLEVRLRNMPELKDFLRKNVQKALDGSGEKKNRDLTPMEPAAAVHFDFTLKEEAPQEQKNFSFSLPQPLAIHKHFLLFSAEELKPFLPAEKETSGIAVMHLKRARQRLFYEKCINGDETQLQKEMQLLFFPEKISFSRLEIGLVEKYWKELTHYGIDLRPFGGDVFVLEAINPDFEKSDYKTLILHLAEILDAGENPAKRKKMALALCGHAGESHFDIYKGRAIFRSVVEQKCPLDSPCGKPIFIFLDEEEIEKR